jgi:integrase
MNVLEHTSRNSESDYVFPGARQARLSPPAMRSLVLQMGHSVTVHGFRAAFRTWAAERTIFARELIETALAHVVGDDTERAYHRGDLFEKRRELMDAWAAFCDGPGNQATVLPFAHFEPKIIEVA